MPEGDERALDVPSEQPGSATIPVAAHIWQYAQKRDLIARASTEIASFLKELAQSASITVHSIDARPKSLDSYISKSGKLADDGAPKYSDPGIQIRDCVAARVILFTTDARDLFVQLLSSHAEVTEYVNPGFVKFNGYDSEHLVISDIKDDEVKKRYGSLSRYLSEFAGLEIQFRSVAAHAWAEYEHDVRYKPGAYQDLSSRDRKQIDQWFVEAGGMRRVMDDLFAKIEARLNGGVPGGAVLPKSLGADLEPAGQHAAGQSDTRTIDTEQDEELSVASREDDAEVSEEDASPLNSESLASLIARRFPGQDLGEVRSIDVIARQLSLMAIDSIDEVELKLSDIDSDNVARLMGYVAETTGSRRLDDELLAALEDEYVSAAVDSERHQILSARLRRVRGKFSIYELRTAKSSTRLVTAARAVRLLAALVAGQGDLSRAYVPGVIAESSQDLNTSTRPRPVRTKAGIVYVATNLSRISAEGIMGQLAERLRPGLVVVRGGDVIFESGSRVDGG